MSTRDDQKSLTRERIMRAAVTLMKERGVAGASISDVMKRAGLTVGGFYAHFKSKNALASTAVRSALQARRTEFLQVVKERNWRSRIGFALHGYFTKTQRDDPVGGCPLPGVIADAMREKATRRALGDEVVALAQAFRGDAVGAENPAAREAALGAIALMAGGLALSRALGDTELSDEVLRACRNFGQSAVRQIGRERDA